jgi:hypothetical protein
MWIFTTASVNIPEEAAHGLIIKSSLSICYRNLTVSFLANKLTPSRSIKMMHSIIHFVQFRLCSMNKVNKDLKS